MTDNAKAMVLGSFLGDSLALGVHWIYDQSQIVQAHGRLDSLKAPHSGSYHPTKQAGDFTHYGDQALLLLQCVADASGFDPVVFSARWRAMFEGGYTGYVDRATRNTLSQLAAGWEPQDAGSASDDLSAAARIAPLVYAYRNDLAAMVAACRAQAAMTHNNGKVLDASEFLARTAHAVLSGVSPIEAMTAAITNRFPGSPLHGWFKQGLDAANEDSILAIARFGQSCHVDGAFQSVVQLMARHQGAPAEAMVDSAMAGGDSAARNMIVGMVLCAQSGMEGIPQGWLGSLAKKDEIEALLARLG